MKRSQILIVEDDQDIRSLCQEILESEGFQVEACSNGKDAITYLQGHQQPSVILLDMMMPVMNGREFMSAYVQKKKKEVKTPVYLISATAEKSDSREMGCRGFLKKPFDFDALLNIVRSHCQEPHPS
jgi:CheY-like chemotaxis protein